ncbi:MAG: hypothetical protein GIW99_02340 [Candidatus Eremiobacteraeota bacterium]|nr:hypothetical protein [Candidatus Eremiobacteraeota bacterium]MBC5826515.1 hypothetical protein [Candidatus Eremiobacteraeota bacterium]
MPRKDGFPSLDLNQLALTALSDRPSKVSKQALVAPPRYGDSFQTFWQGLPDVLAVRDLRSLVSDVAAAYRADKIVAIGMGGHVIKTGLSPLIIDLMRTGIVKAVASNGSMCIHDVELAIAGKTSEDVDASLRDGSFGMSAQTADFILSATAAQASRVGLGRALGEALLRRENTDCDISILAQGAALGIPVTVHVSIGSDVIHMHPQADGAALGAGSLHDFRRFCEVIAGVTHEGAYLNLGSAVVMPETFLKALSVARNLGHRGSFVTADFDFIRHYRPRTNVVVRPHLDSGRGYMFTGHHEIMLPLFAAGLRSELS